MFSTQQKQEISAAVQKILRDTKHPELPKKMEISFRLFVKGEETWSWAEILNNTAYNGSPGNPFNERPDRCK